MNSLERFSKNIQIQAIIKTRSEGTQLFHAGGRTQRQRARHDEANSRFSQFCERAWNLVL